MTTIIINIIMHLSKVCSTSPVLIRANASRISHVIILVTYRLYSLYWFNGVDSRLLFILLKSIWIYFYVFIFGFGAPWWTQCPTPSVWPTVCSGSSEVLFGRVEMKCCPKSMLIISLWQLSHYDFRRQVSDFAGFSIILHWAYT